MMSRHDVTVGGQTLEIDADYAGARGEESLRAIAGHRGLGAGRRAGQRAVPGAEPVGEWPSGHGARLQQAAR
jgi:hypothetical protein